MYNIHYYLFFFNSFQLSLLHLYIISFSPLLSICTSLFLSFYLSFCFLSLSSSLFLPPSLPPSTKDGQLSDMTPTQIMSYSIVVTTTMTARTMLLNGVRKGFFTHILLDEAAQVCTCMYNVLYIVYNYMYIYIIQT